MKKLASRFNERLCLALAVLACGVGLLLASPHANANDADTQKIEHFKLSSGVITHYAAATRALQQLSKTHPGASLEENGDKNASLTQKAAMLDKQPLLHSALAGAGMTSEDYLLCTMAVIQSSLYASLVQNQGAKAWSDIPPGTPTDNVKFVLAHEAEIEEVNKLNSSGN